MGVHPIGGAARGQGRGPRIGWIGPGHRKTGEGKVVDCRTGLNAVLPHGPSSVESAYATDEGSLDGPGFQCWKRPGGFGLRMLGDLDPAVGPGPCGR